MSGYVYMSCGCLLGGHRFGCEDAIPWTDEERRESEEMDRAAESDARAWLEVAS